jgi:putative RecB family exonuclease
VADPSPNASTVHLPVVADSAGSPPKATGHEHYSYSRLNRYTQCPLSFRLHYIDQLPALVGPEMRFGKVLHRTQESLLRDHVRMNATGPLSGPYAVAAFRAEWTESSLNDHGLYAEGMRLLRSWMEREGNVDYREVLGIEQDFDLRIGPHRLIGAIDRVDRIADDAVRVRDYKSTRLPPNRQDVEESLQLAIYDLAARQLWPWAKRVEVGFDLLRHDVLLTTERTDEEREATRHYILASIEQIETAQSFRARPSTLCPHCDHREQCWDYGEALKGKRPLVCTDHGDLVAVSQEREELAMLLKVLAVRKDELDAVLMSHLEGQDVLDVEGRRYSITTSARKEHALEPTLDALADAGVTRKHALSVLATVDGRALKRLVDEIADRVPREKLVLLKATLDARAKRSLSSRLTVRGPRS